MSDFLKLMASGHFSIITPPSNHCLFQSMWCWAGNYSFILLCRSDFPKHFWLLPYFQHPPPPDISVLEINTKRTLTIIPEVTTTTINTTNTSQHSFIISHFWKYRTRKCASDPCHVVYTAGLALL